MENLTNLNRSQETNITGFASMIAGKVNFNLKEEWKAANYVASRDEIFAKQQPGAFSLHHTSKELKNAIEDILHYIYNDVFQSYEEAKKEENCDDEKLLCYHIFNEVDFVAKSMFPGVKFM